MLEIGTVGASKCGRPVLYLAGPRELINKVTEHASYDLSKFFNVWPVQDGCQRRDLLTQTVKFLFDYEYGFRSTWDALLSEKEPAMPLSPSAPPIPLAWQDSAYFAWAG